MVPAPLTNSRTFPSSTSSPPRNPTSSSGSATPSTSTERSHLRLLRRLHRRVVHLPERRLAQNSSVLLRRRRRYRRRADMGGFSGGFEVLRVSGELQLGRARERGRGVLCFVYRFRSYTVCCPSPSLSISPFFLTSFLPSSLPVSFFLPRISSLRFTSPFVWLP